MRVATFTYLRQHERKWAPKSFNNSQMHAEFEKYLETPSIPTHVHSLLDIIYKHYWSYVSKKKNIIEVRSYFYKPNLKSSKKLRWRQLFPLKIQDVVWALIMRGVFSSSPHLLYKTIIMNSYWGSFYKLSGTDFFNYKKRSN